MANTPPIIDVYTRCRHRTEYDSTPPSESMRLQVGADEASYIDLSLRGPLAGKIVKGGQYQITITEITS